LQTFLILIRLLVPILIQEKLKPISLTSLAALSQISSIISCFNIVSTSTLILYNLTWTIAKINFVITYLTKVAQDWFEVSLNEEDQDILQNWLSNWNLFVDKLCWHFGLSDSIGEVANILDNLYMKPSNKISTYNINFMCYVSQLGWENSVLCHCYYQDLFNWIQNPIFI